MTATREFRGQPERAYVRDVVFGIELLDAVTLEPVSQGVRVVAEGLQSEPVISAGGVFAWFHVDFARLRKVTIDPLLLPYEKLEIAPAGLTRPLTRIELRPRVDYAFGAGLTGLRGALIESRDDVPPVPVRGAEVRLRWLDENSVWRDAPGPSRTNDDGGFAAFLRLTPDDVPLLDKGAVTVRLRASRDAGERQSADLQLPQGRIADPSTFKDGAKVLTFAWDELQP